MTKRPGPLVSIDYHDLVKRKFPPPANTLRCYCCGRPIGETFSLVHMQIQADRVFIMLDEHVGLDHKTVVQVNRRKKP